MIKKLFALTLCLMLLASLFVACTSDDETADSDSTPVSESTDTGSESTETEKNSSKPSNNNNSNNSNNSNGGGTSETTDTLPAEVTDGDDYQGSGVKLPELPL